MLVVLDLTFVVEDGRIRPYSRSKPPKMGLKSSIRYVKELSLPCTKIQCPKEKDQNIWTFGWRSNAGSGIQTLGNKHSTFERYTEVFECKAKWLSVPFLSIRTLCRGVRTLRKKCLGFSFLCVWMLHRGVRTLRQNGYRSNTWSGIQTLRHGFVPFECWIWCSNASCTQQ